MHVSYCAVAGLETGGCGDAPLTVSVQAEPNSATVRRVVDRLGEDAVCEMIEARQHGM